MREVPSVTEYKIIALGFTNCYLLPAKDGYLLIDCGSAWNFSALQKALRRLGIGLSQIKYLLLTHHHGDHCGLVQKLTVLNPDLRIIVSEKAVSHLAKGQNESALGQEYSGVLSKGIFSSLSALHMTSFPVFTIRQNDVVVNERNRDILSSLGINAKILFTPGHTDDSISVVADGIAFAGDAVRNAMLLAGSPHMPFLFSDRDACLKSWALLKESAELLCPGHGKPFSSELLSI